MEFRVPNAVTSKLFDLLAKYGDCESSTSVVVCEGINETEFSDINGTRHRGCLTATRYLAGASSRASQLLGETAEQQAKVAEWLTFSKTELCPLLDEKLELLNEWLLSRTFLVGHQLSLADLVIYGTISPAVVTFPVAQHGHFQNLLRWYDHIHSLADPTSIFPPARFQKPKLIRPLPVAPKPTKSEQPTASSSALTSAEAKEKSEERAKKSVTGKSKGGDTKGTSKQPPVTPQASAEVFHNKASASTESSNDGPTVDSVDIRVGLIKSVGPHPNADSLYVEEIDVGEEAPRQVVSGLRKFVPLEKMEGRKVVVVCNLKPAKMREVMSYGMVLCSSNADHTAVDPIIPPADAIPGERVRFEGFSSDPEPQLNPRKKIFEKIAVDLKTNADGLCTYKGIPFMTSTGPVTSTIPNANIA